MRGPRTASMCHRPPMRRDHARAAIHVDRIAVPTDMTAPAPRMMQVAVASCGDRGGRARLGAAPSPSRRSGLPGDRCAVQRSSSGIDQTSDGGRSSDPRAMGAAPSLPHRQPVGSCGGSGCSRNASERHHVWARRHAAQTATRPLMGRSLRKPLVSGTARPVGTATSVTGQWMSSRATPPSRQWMGPAGQRCALPRSHGPTRQVRSHVGPDVRPVGRSICANGARGARGLDRGAALDPRALGPAETGTVRRVRRAPSPTPPPACRSGSISRTGRGAGGKQELAWPVWVLAQDGREAS